jgi:ATP-dependent Lhr-like helicase
MVEAREELAFLSKDATTAVTSQSEGRTYWWTFAGLRANAALADAMRQRFNVGATADNLAIKIEGLIKAGEMQLIGASLKQNPPPCGSITEVVKAVEGLKFSTCVPIDLAESMLLIRLSDAAASAHTVNDPLRVLTVP